MDALATNKDVIAKGEDEEESAEDIESLDKSKSIVVAQNSAQGKESANLNQEPKCKVRDKFWKKFDSTAFWGAVLFCDPCKRLATQGSLH